MKKKGFTLIELLAVIVILAIIALIATPLVLKYIEKSRKESKVDSAYSFVRNLETEIANFSIKHNGKKYNGQPTDKGYYELSSFKDSEIDTTVKGDKPNSIKVCLSSLGQVEKAILQYGKYYVSYDGKKSSISDKDTYDNFSCSGNVTKIEVPEATEEIAAVLFTNAASIENNQGIIYSSYRTEEEIKVAIDLEQDIFNYVSSYVGSFVAPISLFKENLPSDGCGIDVLITYLDGSTETIQLNTSDNSIWSYSIDEGVPYLASSDSFEINFRPNFDLDGNYSTSYHHFDIDVEETPAHGLQSITILGATLNFNSRLMASYGTMNGFYNDITSLKRIIVNYTDGTQYEFNINVNNFDDVGNLGVKSNNRGIFIDNQNVINIIYYDIKNNYKDDVFSLLPQLSTITVETIDGMITYKIADDAVIYYVDPAD